MNGPNSEEQAGASGTAQAQKTVRANWTDYSPAFNEAMATGLKVQAVLGVLTSLILDMGEAGRSFLIALLCQWATVFILLVRRPMAPTKVDLEIVRLGIIPLVFIVYIFGPILLHSLGIATK